MLIAWLVVLLALLLTCRCGDGEWQQRAIAAKEPADEQPSCSPAARAAVQRNSHSDITIAIASTSHLQP